MAGGKSMFVSGRLCMAYDESTSMSSKLRVRFLTQRHRGERDLELNDQIEHCCILNI